MNKSAIAKVLQLRNLFATYEKVNRGSKNEVYYSSHMNNYIVFSPFHNCTTESICNAISSEAYDYLMKTLNTSRNVIVLWSQVEGTTSDYTIYIDAAQDVTSTGFKSIMDILSHKKGESIGLKYSIVKDGQRVAIR